MEENNSASYGSTEFRKDVYVRNPQLNVLSFSELFVQVKLAIATKKSAKSWRILASPVLFWFAFRADELVNASARSIVSCKKLRIETVIFRRRI